MESITKKYKISVIIPTYNRSTLLGYTLNSLIKQNISKDQFEVIVCDDGSTDNTTVLIEKYKNKLNIKYTYQEDKGYRPGSARNTGIKIAEGEICLFIDTSVLLSPNCLIEHIKFYNDRNFSKSALGYVYGFYHKENSDTELENLININDVDESILYLQQFSAYNDIREYSYKKYNDEIENLPAPWFYFWTCHASVGADILKEVGMFDENFDGNWGGEDNDLGLRLHANGIKICLLRGAKSIHYPHDDDQSDRKIKGLKNRIYFNDKFNTNESELFLEIFRSEFAGYTDLNDLILRSAIEA